MKVFQREENTRGKDEINFFSENRFLICSKHQRNFLWTNENFRISEPTIKLVALQKKRVVFN